MSDAIYVITDLGAQKAYAGPVFQHVFDTVNTARAPSSRLSRACMFSVMRRAEGHHSAQYRKPFHKGCNARRTTFAALAELPYDIKHIVWVGGRSAEQRVQEDTKK